MSELIDREATVKQICKMGEMVGGHDRDVVISIALFVQDDKTAFPTITIPTAELDTTNDFAEWVFDYNFKELGNPYGTYKCSSCGGHSPNEYSFCPNCGADMRKEGEAE